VRGGEINPRLPFLGAAVVERFRRNPELHEYPPEFGRPSSGGLGRVMVWMLAQFGAGLAEIAEGLLSGFAGAGYASSCHCRARPGNPSTKRFYKMDGCAGQARA
jgi:hypothetical protein